MSTNGRRNRQITRQQPTRRGQNSKKRRRPFYKHGWFWSVIGIGLFLGLFLMMTTLKQSNATQEVSTQSTALLTLSSNQVHTNAKGVATIKGRSPAGTTITATGGSQITVPKSGRFHFTYKLATPQKTTVIVTAKSIANTTATDRVVVVPSAKYLRSLQTTAGNSANSQSSKNEPSGDESKTQTAADSTSGHDSTPVQPETKAEKKAEAASPLNAKQTVDWTVENTAITNIETSVDNGQLTLTVNWKNIDNQDMPMFVSLFNEPTVQQGGNSLEPIQNSDSATALLPQFQSTVGATTALKYLFKIGDTNTPLTVNLSTRDGQTKAITIGTGAG